VVVAPAGGGACDPSSSADLSGGSRTPEQSTVFAVVDRFYFRPSYRHHTGASDYTFKARGSIFVTCTSYNG
jgi:hypothetical protein